jgi:hypothetical protein
MSRKKRAPSQDMVQLEKSGVFVPRAVHDALYPHILGQLPSLKYGEPLKSKDMVDRKYYITLRPHVVGACVADWELHRRLPIRFLGCPYCSVRYYERT